MTVLIDIIGATLILGILILSIFGMDTNLNQANYNKTFTLITQTNCVTLARIIEFDFVKMGYHVPKDSSVSPPRNAAIIAVKSDSIVFKADLRNNGTVNTVRYYIGSTSTLGSTKNPRDRMLYRVEDGNVIAAHLGLTNLSFSYYNGDGIATSRTDSIRSVNVFFTVESPEPVDTTYSAAFWQKKIYPKNLNPLVLN